MSNNLSLEEYIDIKSELKIFFNSKNIKEFDKNYYLIERLFLIVFGYASNEYYILESTKNDYDYLIGLYEELNDFELIKDGETIDKIYISRIPKSVGKELMIIKRRIEKNLNEVLEIAKNISIFDIMKIKNGEIKKVSKDVIYFGFKSDHQEIVGKLFKNGDEILYERITYNKNIFEKLVNIFSYKYKEHREIIINEVPNKILKKFIEPEMMI
jgi:hypothetical protein